MPSQPTRNNDRTLSMSTQNFLQNYLAHVEDDCNSQGSGQGASAREQ
jgi:hypothetical protein